jgi:hypothetical protein
MKTACCCASGLWISSLASAILFNSINSQPYPSQCIQLNISSIGFSVLILVINILLPFVICSVSYIRILSIAKMHSRRVENQERPPHITTSNTVKNLRESRNKKAKRTISFLVGTFAVFCLPFSVFHIIDAISRKYLYEHYIEMFVKWLSYCNSTFNWALYAFSNREFKFPLLELIPRGIRRLIDRNYSNTVVVLSGAWTERETSLTCDYYNKMKRI